MLPITAETEDLRRIGWPSAEPPPGRVARIIEQHRSGYVAADAPERAFKVESPPEWMRPRFPNHERAAVGDWVLLEGLKIVSILPRRTSIKRGAAGEHYHQQVIAANIDAVFIVVGLDDDFNPRRIERYLLLVGGGGAQPVVVLTKADESDAQLVQAAVESLQQLDAPIFAVNAKDFASVDALNRFLGAGQSVVMVGSSGAGKSTLTNTLLGRERMKTGAVRERDSRGRHTTTHRALIALPSGACIIDTPGMRELKPTGEEDLAEGGFADVEELATQCKFRDCMHHSEPGCAVRAAIARDELDEARLNNYFKLHQEVANAASKLAQRVAEQKAEAAAKEKAHGKR